MTATRQQSDFNQQQLLQCGQAPSQACLSLGLEHSAHSQPKNRPNKHPKNQQATSHKSTTQLSSSAQSDIEFTWYEVATQCISAGLWMGLLVFAPLMAGIALY